MFRNLNLRDEFKAQSEANPHKYGYPNHEEIAQELGAKQVHYDIVDTWRWGDIVEYVYQRGNQYVQIVYREASGDGECDYDPEFYEVQPVEKTVVVYDKT